MKAFFRSQISAKQAVFAFLVFFLCLPLGTQASEKENALQCQEALTAPTEAADVLMESLRELGLEVSTFSSRRHTPLIEFVKTADWQPQAIRVHERLLNQPSQAAKDLKKIVDHMKLIRDIEKRGIQLEVEDIVASPAFAVKSVDKDSQDPIAKWIRNRMDRYDLTFGVDDINQFHGEVANAAGVSSGTGVFIRSNILLSDREYDQHLAVSVLAHEIVHSTNSAKCLKTDDCSRTISFRSQRGKINRLKDYERRYRSDEFEAWLTGMRISGESNIRKWTRKSGPTFLNQIEMLEKFKEFLRDPKYPVSGRAQQIFLIKMNNNLHVEIKFEFLRKKFSNPQEAREFFIETVERRLKQLSVYKHYAEPTPSKKK